MPSDPETGPVFSPAAGEAGDRSMLGAGAVLRYRAEGSGPAVLLIHGWGLDLQMWDPQVRELSEAFQLCRFDRRGFGLSSGTPSLQADVLDAERLCEILRLRKLACVGMSQGCRVALRLAQVAPQLVACLVFDGPPDLLAQESEGECHFSLAPYRRLLGQEGIQSVRASWRQHPLMQLHSPDPHGRRLLERMIARYPGNDLTDAALAAALPVDAAWLRSMDLPVLVVTGAHDQPGRVSAADQLAATLRDAQRVSVCDAGHLPNLDNPGQYNSILRRFLASHLPSAT